MSDAKLRSLKSKSAPYKVSDAEGLYILVTVGGSKLWRLAYRHGGKQKTLALGQYPLVSLFEARRARDAAKQLLRDGTDPSAVRKSESRKRSMAAANTFETDPEANLETLKANLLSFDAARTRHVGRSPNIDLFDPNAWQDEFVSLGLCGPHSKNTNA